ncbi:thioesterase II family protein [Neomicrococcus lactis]|uniref:thioesterase II family protein n=1 Tax=Neomicrococcus lactis TaxID=732241 RepID=UPI0023014BB8|nr:alpha/beta fold hydrolase [Neomicrococcus lactis]
MALLNPLPGQKSTPASQDVLLLPHAGALPSTYIPWVGPLREAFGETSVRLSTAVLPGHVSSGESAPRRATELHSLHRYGDRLAQEILAQRISKDSSETLPLIIFGHSMGALLAVETMRALSEAGHAVLGTVLSASAAPVKRKRFARAPIYVRESAGELRELNDREALEFLVKMGGIPRELADQPEVALSFLPQIRRDFELVDAYRFTPPPTFNTNNFLTLSGSEDDRASTEKMRDWHELLGVNGSHREFPGGHFYHQQHAPEIAAALAGFAETPPS